MRTQITLNDAELELLDRAARASGASRSELIRRAIHTAYGSRSKKERTAALQRSAGAWRERDVTGADYVDAIRDNLDDRLSRLGLA
ncbi:MAG: CopG family transcriptional regulator [Mycobacterium sp.]|uniref:ribbon-helix-helix domain-containing protein n=1 Tax=Mycobacterium sp. TaxID=1785 RepID=UPI003C73FA1D